MIYFPAREARRRSLALFAMLSLCASIASAQLPSDVPSLAPMIEKVSPAVVNIAVSGSVKADNPLAQDEFLRRFFDFDGQSPNGKREIEAAGSGVIVDAKKGYILTNHHVVENADKITVTLADDRSLSAKVVGSDEGSDLAVLQVKDDNARPDAVRRFEQAARRRLRRRDRQSVRLLEHRHVGNRERARP